MPASENRNPFLSADQRGRENGWCVALILVTLACSWLGMQIVHEAGHVAAARVSGGTVVHVQLTPWSISATDVKPNPSPLLVAWGGPLVGALLPVVSWLAVHALRLRIAYLIRFFAGFCLIANGAYIGVGAFVPVGDAAELLRLESARWLLVLFGLLTVSAGLALWHRQGTYFGLGRHPQAVNRADAIVGAALLAGIVVVEAIIQ